MKTGLTIVQKEATLSAHPQSEGELLHMATGTLLAEMNVLPVVVDTLINLVENIPDNDIAGRIMGCADILSDRHRAVEHAYDAIANNGVKSQ